LSLNLDKNIPQFNVDNRKVKGRDNNPFAEGGKHEEN
jgi:hypothetical protein